ncbi:MAG: hypothetical protein KatS3mg118_2785 [Paracoccaceae bacterium]|nr:MAG: hypothetical protein KatS3mg118_2785 [Paracoccaceae bacterium]
MTLPSRRQLIAEATRRLAAAGVEEPAREARLLMRFAAGLDGAGLGARLDERAEPAEATRFAEALARRAARVPMAQITGRRSFWGRDFRVTPDVLDPRPETETLIERALGGPVARRILDLGTGSGCILLTLLAEWPTARGVGVDLSEAALAVAAENAERLGLAHRAEFRRADWAEGVEGPFDLIVANPPYVAEAELAGLAPEVRLHEPHLALAGGIDGLAAYRRIAPALPRLLTPRGGRVLFEIGRGQDRAVARHPGRRRAGADRVSQRPERCSALRDSAAMTQYRQKSADRGAMRCVLGVVTSHPDPVGRSGTGRQGAGKRSLRFADHAAAGEVPAGRTAGRRQEEVRKTGCLPLVPGILQTPAGSRRGLASDCARETHAPWGHEIGRNRMRSSNKNRSRNKNGRKSLGKHRQSGL